MTQSIVKSLVTCFECEKTSTENLALRATKKTWNDKTKGKQLDDFPTWERVCPKCKTIGELSWGNSQEVLDK